MAGPSAPDETAGKSKRLIPRKLLRCLVLLVLVVLLFFGLSNLWLNSRWGRGMVEDKLAAKTGYDWEVGTMTWSPWNGCSIGQLVMLVPEAMRTRYKQPVVRVERIKVQPYWRELLRGAMRPREIIVESPRVQVPLEMLIGRVPIFEVPEILPTDPPALLAANLDQELPGLPEQQGSPDPSLPMAQQTDPQPDTSAAPSPTEVASADQGPPDPKASGASTARTIEVEAGKTRGAVAAEAKPSAFPPTAAQPGVARPPARMPSRVRLTQGSVRIVTPGRARNLINISGIALDLPVYGEDRAGSIKATEIGIAGMTPISNYEQEVMWKRPFLEIIEDGLDTGGLTLRFRAQLSPQRGKGGNFPFSLDLAVDPQQVEQITWLAQRGLDVKARGLVVRSKLVGLASKPMMWQGQFLALGRDLTVTGLRGNQRLQFDEMSMPALLRRGKLYWGGAKLIGEDLSFLGNGRASMRGGLVAVTRLVASPEMATELAKSIHRAGIAQGGWWHELETPDRLVRDLTVSGSILRPVVDAGDNYSSVPLAQLVLPLLRTAAARANETTAPEPNRMPENGISQGKN